MNEKHSHYFKKWFGKIDIYRMLDLFDVMDPAIQHAIKKLTLGGKRGAKDKIKDYQEAIDSINRAIEMIKEDEEVDRIADAQSMAKAWANRIDKAFSDRERNEQN